jgi:hypothetical protein
MGNTTAVRRAGAWLLLVFAMPVPAAAADVPAPNRLTDAERRAGWRLLFDGATTNGWVEVTGKPFPASWTIEDGCLKTIVRKDGFQDIRTVESFRYFELQFDWKLLADGNSGVKYLIQRVDEWVNQAGRQARARGLEYQLADDHNSDAASDVKRVAASLYSAIAPNPHITPAVGSFNHSLIVVTKDRIEHWLNGTKVIDAEITSPAVHNILRASRSKKDAPDAPLILESPISLQNHASEAWFRNIKIR